MKIVYFILLLFFICLASGCGKTVTDDPRYQATLRLPDEIFIDSEEEDFNDRKRTDSAVQNWLIQIAGESQIPTQLISITAFPDRGVIQVLWGDDKPNADGILIHFQDDDSSWIPFDKITMGENMRISKVLIVYEAWIFGEKEFSLSWKKMLSLNPDSISAQLTERHLPVGSKVPIVFYSISKHENTASSIATH